MADKENVLPTAALTEGALQRFQAVRGNPSNHVADLFASALVSSLIGQAHEDSVRVVRVAAATTLGGACELPGEAGRYDVATCALLTAARIRAGKLTASHSVCGTAALAACAAAAWSVGISEGQSWQAIVAAFATGLECQMKLALATDIVHTGRSWDLGALTAVVGAAYTAGLLLDLEPSRLAQAVGIAASQTVGAPVMAGSRASILHAAKPAANGVMSAFLVAEGFTGPASVLEVHRGWFAVVADTTVPLDGLGLGDPTTEFVNELEISPPEAPKDLYLLAAPLQRLFEQIERAAGHEMVLQSARSLAKELKV